MKMKNVEDIYPLSPMQQAMLVHSISTPASRVSFEQSCDLLEGAFQILAFKRAWEQVIERHPILRTFFIGEVVGEPLQIVRQQVDLPWQQYDWQAFSALEQEKQLEELLQKDQARGFDLSKAPLMRLALIQITNDAYYIVWSFHHIILDGWSKDLVRKEVFARYSALCAGQEICPARVRPYRDYIAWLQQQEIANAEQAWRIALGGFAAPTRLRRTLTPAPESLEERYGQHAIHCSSETTLALQAVAQQYQVTLNTLVQGVWSLLLSHYSDQNDVLFGTTVSGRPTTLPGAESMVGLFINILPVRVHVSPGGLLGVLLKEIQDQQLELDQFAYSSLLQIQEWSDVPWNLLQFESLLVFENYLSGRTDSPEQRTSFTQRTVYATGQTSYPLTVIVNPGDELHFHITYDCRHFEQTFIERLARLLLLLADDIAAQADDAANAKLAPLSEVDELTVRDAGSRPASEQENEMSRVPSQNIAASRTVLAPRDTLELQLIQIWEDLLHVHPIGITDNFFALGGHSLLALRLITQIHKQLGQLFPLSLLAQSGTIKQLAQALREQKRSLMQSPLVTLQPHGSKRPFFCIHPASGNVLCYRHLAFHLGPDQPFYALCDPDIYRSEFPEISIEETASRYLRAIRSVQPEGPYQLGGFSFGGIVAFEMAQQLHRQGQATNLLALLDSASPLSTQGFALDDNAGYLSVITMEAIRRFSDKSSQEVYNDLRTLELDDQLDYVLKQVRLTGQEPPEDGPLAIRHDLQVFKSRTHIIRRYMAQRYPGRLTFFKAQDHDGNERRVDEEWQQLTTEHLEVYSIPGYHDTILDEPNVQVLSKALQCCLGRVVTDVLTRKV